MNYSIALRASHTNDPNFCRTKGCTMAANAAKFDLTATFGRFLDPHLLLPLLDHLEQKKVRAAGVLPLIRDNMACSEAERSPLAP